MCAHNSIIKLVVEMIKDTNLNVRVNGEVKAETEAILDELGLSFSTAIDLYLAQIIKKRGIPFEVKLPNAQKVEKSLKMGKIINSLGGVETNPKLNKIIHLYANGDISYNVALYAIKEIIHNV